MECAPLILSSHPSGITMDAVCRISVGGVGLHTSLGIQKAPSAARSSASSCLSLSSSHIMTRREDRWGLCQDGPVQHQEPHRKVLAAFLNSPISCLSYGSDDWPPSSVLPLAP